MLTQELSSIPRSGLVGEFLLNGNPNDTNDGTKNNGTATNVTYVDSPIGYQRQWGSFNGTSSVVQCAYQNYSTGEVHAVFNLTSLAGQPVIWCSNQNSNGSNNYFQCFVSLAGAIQIYNPSLGVLAYTANGVITTGVTYYAQYSQNGTSIALWLNGARTTISNEVNSNWLSYPAGANQFCIGALKRGSEFYSGVL